MKVLQVNASYKPAVIYGGPTMSVSKLSEELCKNGINTEVITTLANGKNELNFPVKKIIYIENVPVRFFKRITKDHTHFSPGLIKHLLKIKKTETTIIHIHAWWNLVSIFTCLIAQLKNIPVVLSPRGTLSYYSFNKKHNLIKRWIHFLAGKKLLSNCYLHVTSEAEKTEILKLFQPKKIQVIANFISFPTNLEIKSDKKTLILKLLFMSRIDPKKGLEILLEALAGIDFPYHLTIAGTGEQDYIIALQKIVAKNSMQPFVSWVGFQNQQSKFKILQQHDLLVLPSHNENFGNVVIESLAVGTPVLISKNVGLADYVIKNNLGFTFDNYPKELQKQLKNLYKNSICLDEIRSKAPQKIREDFAETSLVKKYVDFYQQIITTN
ncbi:XrtY-associated glycosyltransferase XYAG1 [Mucilaginibacter sp.]|uniref:XrtY-associated glycosyltransferase XYAG1 n=1 Tax=Mucilaginibacter sp. TaxID=1882438 RepID=UPI003AFF94BF